MKTRIFLVLTIFVMSFSMIVGCGTTPQTSGTNAKEVVVDYSTYSEIASVEELMEFRDAVNGNDPAAQTAKVVLKDDIVIPAGTEWEPIGHYERPFKGIFDGNNKKVTGLVLDNESAYTVGLFGVIEKGNGVDTEVRNIVIEDPEVIGSSDVGALAGLVRKDVVISNVHVTTTTNSAAPTILGNNRVGGIVGNNQGTIQDSSNNANVYGNENVGGIAGSLGLFVDADLWKGNIIDCVNNGDIENGNLETNVTYTGGITGYSIYSKVIGSVNNGNVTTTGQAGGVVGYLESGEVQSSSNTGNISGYSYVAGVIGKTGKVRKSANDIIIKVISSFNTGNITASNDFVAGVVALSGAGTLVMDVYNTGDIVNDATAGTLTSGSNVGGVIAANYAELLGAYNTGAVSSEANKSQIDNIGGVVGDNSYRSSVVVGAYNTGPVSVYVKRTTTKYVAGVVGSNSNKVIGTFNLGTITGPVESDWEGMNYNFAISSVASNKEGDNSVPSVVASYYLEGTHANATGADLNGPYEVEVTKVATAGDLNATATINAMNAAIEAYNDYIKAGSGSAAGLVHTSPIMFKAGESYPVLYTAE